MELNQLRYFLEVAKNEHMTKSAKKLHIAQPSLSQAIHKLEEYLGVKLFVAHGRNIVLTEYGKYLEKRLSPIIEELDKLPEELATMAKLSHDTIHINVLAASNLVTDAIIEYKKNNEEIDFKLIQNTSDELYDIEITTRKPGSRTIRDEQKLDRTYICKEKIFLAVPYSSKYAKSDKISLKAVESEGFIRMAGYRQLSSICDSFCSDIGVNPRIIFESDNPSSVKNMITANMGVGFWPEFTWGKIDDGQVKLLEIEEAPCMRELVITYNLNKNDNGNVLEFFHFLVEFCELKRKA